MKTMPEIKMDFLDTKNGHLDGHLDISRSREAGDGLKRKTVSKKQRSFSLPYLDKQSVVIYSPLLKVSEEDESDSDHVTEYSPLTKTGQELCDI